MKRAKTTSTSQNGVCYVMVELNDNVNNKDEVWSKIKHGMVSFKQQLPPGVLAVVVNDDFGDTSVLLISVESDQRSYRELEKYADELGDRLRRIPSVSNVRPYGAVKEQISIYLDPERMAAYGSGDKTLSGILSSQSLTTASGAVDTPQEYILLHISPSLCNEEEIANQIVYTDNDNHVVRLKDVARVVREYDPSESHVKNNGNRYLIHLAGDAQRLQHRAVWQGC